MRRVAAVALAPERLQLSLETVRSSQMITRVFFVRALVLLGITIRRSPARQHRASAGCERGPRLCGCEEIVDRLARLWLESLVENLELVDAIDPKISEADP